MELTSKLQKAIDFAARLHLGQVRKGDNALPYVSHPFSVAWILSGFTEDEDIVVAGLLHDVLEDVEGYDYADLERDFGARIALIVKDVSEDRDPENLSGDMRASWEARKDRYLKSLAESGQEALIVAAADKIHNLRSMIRSYEKEGEAIWEKFNSPPDKKLWFYNEVLKILDSRLESPIVEEFRNTYEEAEKVIIGEKLQTDMAT